METIFEILISWTPMIILIVVWIIFMKKAKVPQDKSFESIKKQTEI